MTRRWAVTQMTYFTKSGTHVWRTMSRLYNWRLTAYIASLYYSGPKDDGLYHRTIITDLRRKS